VIEWRRQHEWRYPYVCVGCRLIRSLHSADQAGEYPHRCLRCGAVLWCAGNAFEAPRRTNTPQWRKLAVLVAAGHGGFWRHHGEHRLAESVRTVGQAKAYARRKREARRG
jgi:hypothetical protein